MFFVFLYFQTVLCHVLWIEEVELVSGRSHHDVGLLMKRERAKDADQLRIAKGWPIMRLLVNIRMSNR